MERTASNIGDIQASAFPIDCIAVTKGKAKKIDFYGAGLDKVFLFQASPIEYTTPVAGVLTEQQAETLTGIIFEVRNKYSEDIEVDDKLVIVLGADGIGTVVSWECE